MLCENRNTFEMFEIIQFTGKNIDEILEFLNVIIIRVNQIQDGGIRIHTKSRVITIPQNGYVARNISVRKGVVVLLKDEFELTFRKVDDSICDLLRR